jgi:hypothetical protein
MAFPEKYMQSMSKGRTPDCYSMDVLRMLRLV